MKKKSRHSKNIILSLVMVMTLFVSVCSFSFVSNAAVPVFDILMDKPVANEYMGYMEVYGTRNSDGFQMCISLFWYVQIGANTDLGSYTPDVTINVLSSGSISIKPPDYLFFSLHYMNSDGMNTPQKYYDGVISQDTPVTVSLFSGYTIKGWRCYGNVSSATDNFSAYNNGGFIVNYNSDVERYNQLNEIYSALLTANSNDTTMINRLNSIMYNTDTLETKLQTLINICNEYYPEIAEELGIANSWLEKIWNSIQEFISPSDEDKETTDKFEEENKEQSNTMNDLNEQNKTDKVDIDSASGAVDSYIDENAILNYGQLLRIFTEHEYILKCMLVVLAVALVSYVLFGKKR